MGAVVMCVLIVSLFLCLVVDLGSFQDLQKLPVDSRNFGPYDMNFTVLELCKAEETSDNYKAVSLTKSPNGDTIGKIKLSVNKPCALTKTKTKITIFKVNENSKRILFNYKIKNMCQHFALGNIIEMLAPANLDRRNCVLNKGNFSVSVDLNAVTVPFFGDLFFFGKYEFKTLVYCRGEAKNLLCVHTMIEFNKK